MRIERCRLAVALAVSAAVAYGGFAADVPEAVAHRRAMAAGIDDPGTAEAKIAEGLKDADPMVRRYALNALYAKDPARAVEAAKPMLADGSVAVRKVAKSMHRTGGLYRENVARSVDPSYDHAVTRVRTVKVKKGSFRLGEALPEGAWVEISFGKPKEDLRVWLNGTYLGQFDVDSQPGQEFRLGALEELKAPGENALEIRNAKGEPAACRAKVEVMK